MRIPLLVLSIIQTNSHLSHYHKINTTLFLPVHYPERPHLSIKMTPKISPSSYLTPEFVSRYHLAEKLTGVFVAPLVQHSGILSTPSNKPLAVFDNACGLGIVSSYLNSTLPEDVKRHWTLTCGDITELMVEYTKLRIEREGWVNAEAKVVDSQCTGLPADKYTHVLTAFGEWYNLCGSSWRLWGLGMV